jgi:hypothetical protein
MKRAQSEIVKELAKFIIDDYCEGGGLSETRLNGIICEWLIDNNIRFKEQSDGPQ